MVHFESTDAAGEGSLAPVAYLPGAGPGMGRRFAPVGTEHDGWAADDADAAKARDQAEQLLLTRLRARSLSTSESYAILTATGIEPDEADEIIDRFTELRYIDEEKLAEQIVYSHHERKGLGRPGVEAEMRRRGLDACLTLEMLETLPDDEAERAIELATKRIQQMDRLDQQTIDRRLTAFLVRKGYSFAAVRVAVTAALAAREGASGVRFR